MNSMWVLGESDFDTYDFDSRWWEPASEIGTYQDTSVLLANNSPSTTAI